ncbi:Multiple inositol polyphosphate phosphatase 1 [Eufriesea mexicana]|uniref:Multiple inositol polyphosphate phosphatase 1 n=1 Tax=Eufriesea mexicana TaxID=516756 RepID=A0A310SND8_9HYME|nr:PREDICTED: multiple inositol polyphosphate phosphatase 1-like [Eufriesea mexicana]OAD62582.1 Multiple inositol polyphosphate phosphatase 1 [Eufriesea mexicana]
MSSVKIFTILCAVICFTNQLAFSHVIPDYCYSDDNYPYRFAGTKTAYEIEHDLIKDTAIPDCKPIQIWMLIRHGTRYPGKHEIRDMKHKLPKLQRKIIENHENGNGSLCQKDLEKLKSWKLNPDLSVEKWKYLTKQGEEDLSSLGERFKNYFPEIFQSSSADVSKTKYKFRSTDLQRTIASMENFITGLFGRDYVSIDTEIVPAAEDTLLKLYKICKRWTEQMGNSSTNAEVKELINGPLFRQIIDDISQRLGFPNSLSLDDAVIMYTSCVFENAWYINEKSPWCAAFTKDELQLFEYEEDLYYYYHSSYGQEMSSAVGCPPLKDMFTRFAKLENGTSSDEPQGVFYFTHSSALQLFLTSMGIAKDAVPLTASNFDSMGNRKWSTSHLAPFAANLAAIFYECNSSYKVRFYLNERPLEYEGCQMGVCDWDYLKEQIGPNAFNCNADFCSK